MRTHLRLNLIDSTSALQRLFGLQEYSLARYVAQAHLYGGDGAVPCLAVIKDIAEGQSQRASQIGSLLTKRRVPIAHHGFSMSFTGMNYLAAAYVTRQLLERQPELIEDIQACVEELIDDVEGRQLASSALAGEIKNLSTLSGIVGKTNTAGNNTVLAA